MKGNQITGTYRGVGPLHYNNVDGAPYARLINALRPAYRLSDLAEVCGLSRHELGRIANRRQMRIHPATAEKLKALLDLLPSGKRR